MAAGELPIGAVVVMGDDVVGRSFTAEQRLGRRIVHADLLAMIQADERLGRTTRPQPLLLAVNLEPCVMCMGTAMTLGISEVYFGLESPSDGGAQLARDWQNHDDAPFFQAPTVTAGICRAQAKDQFRRFADQAKDSGFSRWARSLAELP